MNCYKCGTQPSSFVETNELKTKEYNHNSEADSPESCIHFEKMGSSHVNEVTCGADQICSKIVFLDRSGNNVTSVQRGCVYKTTAGGYSHLIGCGTIEPVAYNSSVNIKQDIRQYDHACYCDTNYCNGSGATEYSNLYALVVIFCYINRWVYFRLPHMMN